MVITLVSTAGNRKTESMDKDSDLIAIPFIVGVLAAVLIVMAGFFLVGAAAGFPMLIIAMVAVGYFAYRGLKKDTPS